MGVPGLWDIVSKAGESRSLAHLAVVDGFESNHSGRRAYRVGIDASLWYTHAAFSKGGENPQLRLLFFRLRSLAELPILPLFIFDGRERPKEKRGSRMGKSGSHNLSADMKKLLDVFGMEWRMAFGEAEAELAYLNQTGVIDAIMTDDVDALVFGARTLIKNTSVKLSGNKSNPALDSDGKASKHHVMLYSADKVRNHPDIGMSRGGLVLFALLAGGDYDKGTDRFGKAIAHGLARRDFGDQLLTAFEQRDQRDMRPFLHNWRAEINQELRTNAHGFLPHKCPSLSLPPDFPNMQTLRNYASPVSSARLGRGGGGAIRDIGDLNLGRIAGLCEEKFGEWGYQSAIIKRFRDVMWEAAICRVLRRASLEADRKESEKQIAAGRHNITIRGPLVPSREEAVGTPASLVKRYLSTSDGDRRREAFVRRGPSAACGVDTSDVNPLIRKIISVRQHVSTDHLLEYRVEVGPSQLVALARSGIKGTRPDPSGAVNAMADDLFDALLDGTPTRHSPKKTAPDPESVMRMWVPAPMMRQVHPGLVEDFEAAGQAKQTRTPKAKNRGKGRAHDDGEDDDSGDGALRRQGSPTHRQSRVVPSSSDANVGRLQTPLQQLDESPGQYRNPTHFLYWVPFPDGHDPFMPDSDGDVAISKDTQDNNHRYFDSPHAQRVRLTAEGPSSHTDSGPSFDSEEDDRPSSPFDRLFDQVMGFAPSKRTNRSVSRTSKRPRTSEPSRGNTKRRKTADRLATHTYPSSSQDSQLSFDDIIDLT